MGHVTTDRLTDAWRYLNTAEYQLEKGLNDYSLSYVAKTLEECENAAYSLNLMNEFYTMNGNMYREELGRLKSSNPNPDEIASFIRDVRDLLSKLIPHVESELHRRLYNLDDDVYSRDIPYHKMPTVKKLDSIRFF